MIKVRTNQSDEKTLSAPGPVSKGGTSRVVEREVLDPYIYGDPIKQKTKAEFNRWGKKISGSVKKGWKKVFR